jgi:hypothetical protein
MIMPKRGYPVSRDFDMTIKCTNKSCYLHAKAYDECTSPAAVEINSSGVCERFAKSQVKDSAKTGD